MGINMSILPHWQNMDLKNVVGDISGKIQTERWKDVVGYEGLYQASTFGRIKRLRIVHQFSNRECIYPEKICKQSMRGEYLSVGFTKDRVLKVHSVHILCGIAFHPNPQNKRTINHKRGIKTENRYSEIEWATDQENVLHYFRVLGGKGSHTGRFNEKHHASKKILCLNNRVIYPSQHEAARQLGCSQSNITNVCTGKKPSTKGYQFVFVNE